MRNTKTLGAVLATTLLPGLALAGSGDVMLQGFHWKSTAQVEGDHAARQRGPQVPGALGR